MALEQFKASIWRGLLLTFAILTASLRLIYVGEPFVALILVVDYVVMVNGNAE